MVHVLISSVNFRSNFGCDCCTKGSKKRKSNLSGNTTKKRNAKNYYNRKQMEDFIDKNRSNARAYYIRQCNRVKSKARIAYKISKKYKLAYSRQIHALNPGYILQKCKNWYNKNNSKILKLTCYSKKIILSILTLKRKPLENVIKKIQTLKKEITGTI